MACVLKIRYSIVMRVLKSATKDVTARAHKQQPPLRKAKFVESPRIPESELGSPTHTATTTTTTSFSPAKNPELDAYRPGESNQELGPPPSVDEAANTLMTRLGFLLGEKVTEGQSEAQYSMEEQEENQSSAVTQRISPCSTLTSSTASPPANSPCSTLPPVTSGNAETKGCSYGTSSAVTQRISPCSTLTSSTASPPANSPCSTLPPVTSGNAETKGCSYGTVTSPTSTLESRDSGIIATLTSYSENVERSKYGEGSRANLKPWQSQKSGMDSCLYRVDENMTASTYSLNKIPERNLETISSQSVQSIPLYLMPRPNSVAGKLGCTGNNIHPSGHHKSSAVTQRISPCSTLTSSTASPPANSPCSTLPPVTSGNAETKGCSYGTVTSPTSTLESRDSGIIATLTSYSENVERSKYGEGSRANLKPWQSQKSGMDSCLYRVDENMTASTYSLNKIPERNLETISSQSVQSIPLYLMPRPNSVAATSSAHLEDLAYLDEQRHTPLRTSLRMPRQNLGAGRLGQDLRVRFAPYRPPDISLKPLLFEVPSITMDSFFIGRDWLFQEIDGQLRSANSSTNHGVVIVGNIGFGKTAIISRLVAMSCHGTRMRQIASDSPHASPKRTPPLSSSLLLDMSGVSRVGVRI
ncbi:UNVERIFIED_CONTAM: hypothetical protein FKN15_047955 [Acipenser sinensis]